MSKRQLTFALLALVVVATGASGLAQSAGSSQQPITREQFDRWFDQVKNWGRWGANSAIGTLNLITPAKRQRAAGSVRSGIVVSLATEPSLNNPSPLRLAVHTQADSAGPDVTWAWEDLSIEAFHGWANTHMDWLSHTLYRGVLFDGVTSADVRPEGVNLRGVHTLVNGIVTRGVLIDAAELKGASDLAPGVAITTADLEAWEKKTGVKVEEGDVLLVRTGRWAREGRLGPWKIEGSAAGLHPSVALWLHGRGVAAIGSDAVNDVMPSPVQGMFNPLHQLALVGMGMPLFDNLDLEAAVREARAQGRWTFLLSVAPLRIKGGTGSPINPLAIF
jgi:kynurenine formamidase